MKKEAEFEPGLKIPLPMLSVCLPELPLLDLLRVAIFIHLLFQQEYPSSISKKKTIPLGTQSPEAEAPAE